MSQKRKKAVLTGATPVVEQQPREWSMPAINWNWLIWPLVLALIFSFVYLMYSRWPLQNIEIDGRLHYWNEQILKNELNWLMAESYFGADVHKVFQQLDDLALINVVSVRKRWPGTIAIALNEDIPLAVFNGEELLTLGGELVPRPAFVRVDGLARMRGDSRFSERAIRDYRRLHQVLMPHQLAVTELEFTSVGSLSALLSNGWRIEFGRQYFEERLQRLTTLIEKLPTAEVATIDLRYGKGAAVRWKAIGETG